MYRSHQGLNAALLYVLMPDYDKNTDLLVINPITAPFFWKSLDVLKWLPRMIQNMEAMDQMKARVCSFKLSYDNDVVTLSSSRY